MVVDQANENFLEEEDDAAMPISTPSTAFGTIVLLVIKLYTKQTPERYSTMPVNPLWLEERLAEFFSLRHP